MLKVLVLLGLLWSPEIVRAQEPGDAKGGRFDLPLLLDPRQPEGARQEQLSALQATAKDGDHLAICVLGRLAMRRTEVELLGLVHARPAISAHSATEKLANKVHYRLLDAEYGDPQRLLTGCAMGGDLESMLVLAELELRKKKFLESLVWSGVHMRLASRLGGESIPGVITQRARLIAAAREKLPATDTSDAEVFEYVDGFITQHGGAIIAGVQRNGPSALDGLLSGKDDADLAERVRKRYSEAGFIGEAPFPFRSVYLLEVDPTGTVSNAFLLEAYPNTHRGALGWPLTVKYRYGKVKGLKDNRFVLVTLFSENGKLVATTYGTGTAASAYGRVSSE